LYKIKISHLKFFAIIGILDYERKNAQKVEINFECMYENKNQYIDYMQISDFLKSCVVQNKYQLIEDGIDDICSKLKSKYKNMENIYIEIIKHDVLENGYVSISNS